MTRPNILLITADDMEGTTPGAFGGPDGVTPTLDRLAAEGMVFDRAHVAVAVCQPSRSSLMTGLWPHRNGAEGFEPIDDGVPLLTTQLADAGYRTGILGKVTHLQPVDRFAWDLAVDMPDLGMGRDPHLYAERTADFLREAAGEPWFLMVNAHDPHRPFAGTEDQAWDAEQRAGIPAPSRVFTAADAGPVPGYLPEIPDVRTEYAQYLSSSRRCDDVVAAVLDRLEAAGAAESTLVVFLSDNGMAFPFSKANCYLQSTRTPLIVRWPGVVRPGSQVSEAFVSALDLFPTFCEAAGVPAPPSDGRSLVGLLDGTTDRHRDGVVTVFHETKRKARFEMRGVQDDRFGYVWNRWADGERRYRAENMAGMSWQAMLDAARTDEAVAERTHFYTVRAPEELYDLQADPAALHNLAQDADREPVLRERRAVLAAWMERTGDPALGAFRELVDSPAAFT